jgi:Ankyrin repeats (3 copies)/Ankyrin repeats (many copies)
MTNAVVALAMVAMIAAMAGCDAAMGPLHRAAITGDAEFVRSWIAQKRSLDVTFDEPSRGLEGNYARARGVTALMMAARAGQLEIVKLLVEGGANLYAESQWRDGSHPRNAFDYAVEHAVDRSGRPDVVEYLWSRSDGARFAARLDEQIAAACRRTCNEQYGGDARSNLGLFLISVASDRQRGKGMSDAACYAQRPVELLTFLDTRVAAFPKNTLHCAAYVSTVRGVRSVEERIAIVSFFLDRGADLEHFDVGHTPLTGAAAAHDLEMVKLLLARGANANGRNASGMTAIASAANICIYGGTAAQLEPGQTAQLAVIEYLVRAGADSTVYASASERARAQILTSCCSRQPHSGAQRRICEIFNL